MARSTHRKAGFRLLASLALVASALLALPAAVSAAAADDLLLTEVVVTPTGGEFVEIHNPTDSTIDLTDVYLTDATFSGGGTYYYNIVTGSNSGGGGFSDFHARFPAGSLIAAGEYQTVALAGSTAFAAEYGVDPTYELFEDDASADAIADMVEATPGSINGQGGLSNGGEVVVLYRWDGASDLVQDLDYVVWGDKVEAVDKSGVAIDGPDADTDTTMYANDTPIGFQIPVDTGAHDAGDSWQRIDLDEGDEAQTGGNGSFGSDETSENLSDTWTAAAPTPNAAAEAPEPPEGPDPADHLLLTEVVVTPTGGEFVEIHNPTDSTIDLTDVYLTDATFSGGGTYYYNIVTGSNSGGGGFSDFHARFPAGSSIAAGEYQTVALAGSTAFAAEYGVDPTYELFEDDASADAIADMVEATPGSINGQGGLSNGGEFVTIYHWDGASDLVADLDYFVWGDKAEAVDKSGVIIDGPDADSDGSAYANDTAIGFQVPVDTGAHEFGDSWQRRDLSEGDEVDAGGNGITGDDETSEDLAVTWGATAPTPNAATTLEPPDPGGGGTGPGPLPAPGVCGDAFTAIPAIQGPGAASGLVDTGVNTEGVVTALLPGLGGFTIQDAAGDGDVATSDGIFVFAAADGLAVGDAVRVTAHVTEFFDLTELTSLTAESVTVQSCGVGATVAPTTVTLPVAVDFEPYEGMLVHFDEMTITDVFSLAEFGELELSAPERLTTPTDIVLPGAAAATVQDLNNRSRIVLDDASTARNPDPTPYLDPLTRRVGQKVTDLEAVVMCNFGCHKLMPVGDVTFSGNPRPASPDDVGGDLKVAGFNVLNYFTTFDERGANNQDELDRQTAKLVVGIRGLGADVVALQELENNGPVAIGALVDALNGAAIGDEEWAAVSDPAYPGGLESTNAIKVGIIYRADRVEPVGAAVASLDPNFALDRPPVAQTFTGSGETLTVISNHFKSKSCSDTGPGEPFPDEADAGDGQGCFNPRRTRQAGALLDFIAELQASTGDPDVIAIGDFNAYAQEDPVRALRSGGLVDLTDGWDATDRYSFLFFGQSGQLDYAFATAELATKVTGVDIWHINADEPRFLDYNTETNPPSAYVADQYRSSDHDSVLVGIGAEQLAPRAAIDMVITDLEAMLAGGKDGKAIEAALKKLRRAADDENWVDDAHVTNSQVLVDLTNALKDLLGVSGADVDDQIAKVIGAIADIATLAVDEAVNAEGDADKVAQALERLAAAEEAFEAGDLLEAARLYRLAWMAAAEAVAEPRFATYNASLNRFNAGDLVVDLATKGNAQAKQVAEIVQRTRPNVLLINEFDYDAQGRAADLFRLNYLGVSQNGADPISYPYAYVAPSNTGIPSGFDFDNNGSVGGGNDAYGFGFFEGQFGMLVLSQHPLHEDDIRTFQLFLWKDMPGALLPDDPDTAEPSDWYSAEELEVFRLSSKSHWDVPVQVGRETVHFLVSHPTPPVFDGPEDRNGTRNHDEIRFWADYVDPARSGYVYDDEGGTGGLAAGASFVIAGDNNADPFDGDSVESAASQFLDHPLINALLPPASEGGVEASLLQGGINDSHIGNPAYDTADFSDTAPGNLRVDYVLPSVDLTITGSGVFWPVVADPLSALIAASDHRLVWIDVWTG